MKADMDNCYMTLKLGGGATIPRPAMERDEQYGLSNKFRYTPTNDILRADLLMAAWVIDTYGAMLTMPQKQLIELQKRAKAAIKAEEG